MTQLYKDIKRLLKFIYLMNFYSSVFVEMSLILRSVPIFVSNFTHYITNSKRK
jgi:hypothetical protein